MTAHFGRFNFLSRIPAFHFSFYLRYETTGGCFALTKALLRPVKITEADVGHLGFNEPGSPFDSGTRLVTLTPESIESNTRYWGKPELVPRQAFTLGLRTLRSARKTILLVSSRKKANILSQVLEGPITPEVPASMLRKIKNVTVIADRDAASELKQFRSHKKIIFER